MPQIVGPMLDMSGMFVFYKPDKTQSVIDKEKMQAYVKKTWPAIQVRNHWLSPCLRLRIASQLRSQRALAL